MMFKKNVAIILLLLNTIASAENTVVCLVSPPRSLSVGFLRMMHARGDFKILHEPCQFVYGSTFCHFDVIKQWYKDDCPKTYDEVKKKIYTESKTSNVFAKEISFAVRDFILNDNEFIKRPNVYIVFLLRNPHDSVISFYHKEDDKLIDGTFSHLIGYKSCYEIYKKVKEHAFHKPLIMLSENLANNPKRTIQAFCKHVNIEFKEDALKWDNLGDNFNGYAEWNELKKGKMIHHWHGDAIRSTKFGNLKKYERDANGQPTFSEVKPEHLDVVKNAYKENLASYDAMLKDENK